MNPYLKTGIEEAPVYESVNPMENIFSVGDDEDEEDGEDLSKIAESMSNALGGSTGVTDFISTGTAVAKTLGKFGSQLFNMRDKADKEEDTTEKQNDTDEYGNSY